MAKYLVIQTAFIGDAILATAVIETLHRRFPADCIDVLVRKGNEALFRNHPFLGTVHVWDKTRSKYRNLLDLILKIRRRRYDHVINLQRFFSTGLLTALSGARRRTGYSDSPFSFAYHFKIPFSTQSGLHEVARNARLIEPLTGPEPGPLRPALYPFAEDIAPLKPLQGRAYVCLAPGSVWFTKMLPEEKWVELARRLCGKYTLFFLGAPDDRELCDRIISLSAQGRAENLCGKLSLLQSAALMRDAAMNYVNDSAPLHLASSVNAPTTAFFCSTVPEFGFGPLSDQSIVAQIEETLYCRPCGLHGRKKCPQGHFRCGREIDVLRYLPAV